MRIAISSFAALFVTLALFFVMQSMIKGSGQSIEKPLNYGVVDFVRLQQEPADSNPESGQRMPARRPASPPRTLPALSSHSPAAPPAASAPPEFSTESLLSLQLGKPYLDPATAIVPKIKPLDKSVNVNKIDIPAKPARTLEPRASSPGLAKAAPKAGASALLPLPTSDKTPAINVPTLPTGATAGIQGAGDNGGADAIPIFKVEPRYPRKAARSRIEGWVKLEFTITENGTVSDPIVVDSNPRRTFNRSAIQSIRQWRFKPRIVDGRPVQRKATQVIEFSLSRG